MGETLLYPHRLYDFQEDACREVESAFLASKNVLLVAPTGAGKTIMGARIASRVAANIGRVLCVAHRRELLDQMEKVFLAEGLTADYTTIQSSHKVGPKDYDLIVLDEAHHATASSYKQMMLRHSKSRILGMTATPHRLDGAPLKGVFDAVVETPGIASLQDMGVLVEAKEFSVGKKIDVSELKTIRGDYDQVQLGVKVRETILFGDIINEYRRFADGMKSLVFCVDVQHATEVAYEFNKAGIHAASVDGSTPTKQRQFIYDRFHSGSLKILTNCMLYTEGVDVPDIECVIMLRPTKSLCLYLQMAGRGLRRSGDKNACIILDHANNHSIHGTINEDRVWRYSTRKRMVGGNSEINPYPCLLTVVTVLDNFRLKFTRIPSPLFGGMVS